MQGDRGHFIAYVCLVLCGAQCSKSDTSNICGNFIFPTIDGNTLTVRENETVILPFDVVSDRFDKSKNLTIRINQLTKNGQLLPFCTLFRENGKCTKYVSEKNCDCSNTSGYYQFKRKFSKLDSTIWRWKEQHGLIRTENITFNITYPGRVTHFTMGIAQDIVQQGESVEVICWWDEGNPPVTARLLDRHGVEMDGSIYSSGQINYTFPAVGCQDAGLIRCEAPGASENRTETLLVRCPPEFSTTANWTFSAGKNSPSSLSFPLRTHTTNYTSFWLQNMTDYSTACERNCTSFVSLTGSPPDLNLILEFGRPCSKEEGTWNLTLENEAGQGSVQFSLTGETAAAPGSRTLLFLGIGGGAVAVVAVVVVVVVGRFGNIKTVPMRRKSGDGVQFHPDHVKGDEVSPRHSGQDEECVMIPNPVYEGTYGRNAPLESPYFEVADSLRKTPQNAENQAAGGPGSKAGNSDYAYVDAEVVQGWKDSARAAKTDDKNPGCTPDEYVSVEDIKKRKQQAK